MAKNKLSELNDDLNRELEYMPIWLLTLLTIFFIIILVLFISFMQNGYPFCELKNWYQCIAK